MKKLIITLTKVIAVVITAIAQPPQTFKYQAVVRNNAGDVMQNQAIGIRISIHDATASGLIVYQETFSGTTNQFGLVNLDIGNGTPTIGTFTGIDWGNASKFIETEIDPTGGTAYVSMGTSELLSVPYALYSGATVDTSMWRQNGDTIYYHTGNVGIGTSNPADDLHVADHVRVGEDLTYPTIYGELIHDGGGSGFKINAAGGGWADLHFQTQGTTKMFIESAGKVGIGTTSPGATLEVAGPIWQTGTGESVFIGEAAGASDDGSNNQNSFIGFQSGYLNSTGYINTFLGYKSGYKNTSGAGNTFIGNTSGYNNTINGLNTFIGDRSGYTNTEGSRNTYLGYKSGFKNSTGIGNICIGYKAGYWSTDSNKLYIHNEASNSPLIYGEFDNHILVINGKMGIGATNPLSKLSVGGNGNGLATIYGHSTGNYDYSIHGYATGSGGRGVYGYASNNGDVYNYGVYGEAKGRYGKGVYGVVSGNNAKGVFGYATGYNGVGVYGEATSTYTTAIHGFTAASNGRGILGTTTGYRGVSVNSDATGELGIGVVGSGTGVSGKGVVGFGTAYDFDARGPGVDYGSTSSIRYKRNIIEIDNPLEKLSELRGVYFDWDEEHGGRHDVGCIAEEVGKVLPEIVVFEENGIDADGMDYSKLTPLLIEAVKEQQEIIERLIERIEVLENR